MDVLAEFLDYFHLDGFEPSRRIFFASTRAFSRIPYENITKIIRWAEAGSDEKARRGPEEVVSDHIRWGTGGTCFSLTAALCHIVRRMGFEAEYLLADRGYGHNAHSALSVRIDGISYLVDPGFLISEPVPLTLVDSMKIASGGEQFTLIPNANEISLFTERGGKSVHRLTYKMTPVNVSDFLKAWDASFQWEMMHYPLLARTMEKGRIYLRGSMFQVSDYDSVKRVTIPEDELVAKISGEFGIHQGLVERALTLLKKEKHGSLQ